MSLGELPEIMGLGMAPTNWSGCPLGGFPLQSALRYGGTTVRRVFRLGGSTNL